MDGSGMSWGDAVVASVAIAFLFGGIAVVLVWIMKVAQTKVATEASSQHEMLVRGLAEEATAAQRTTATELTEVRLALADMRDRLAKIERMMAEVG